MKRGSLTFLIDFLPSGHTASTPIVDAVPGTEPCSSYRQQLAEKLLKVNLILVVAAQDQAFVTRPAWFKLGDMAQLEA